MPTLTRTIHCIAVDDLGSLASASVTDTPMGTRHTQTDAITKALEMPASTLAQRLPKVRPGDGLVLVVPSSAAHTRPFALTTKRWASAREDVMASVETLFPLGADDARVGVLDMATEGDAAEHGCLVALGSASVRPIIEHVHAALGRTPDAVLAPVQCLPALGVQSEAHAVVLEDVGLGEVVEHTLRFGVPSAMGSAPSDATPGVTRVCLPGVSTETAPDARAITLPELALAGALTPTVSRTVTAPVDGTMPAARSRWLVPAACLLLAGGLLWAALAAPGVRSERALADIATRQADMESDVLRVNALRRDALAQHQRLDDAVAPLLASWTPTLPDLQSVRSALPDDAFLHEVVLEGDKLTVKGVAPEANRVLRAIEESDAFDRAAFVAPPSPALDANGAVIGERFHIDARRLSTNGGAR